MNTKAIKKLRRTIRAEYKREMAVYYQLPFFTRLKWAYCVLFRVYPGNKKA
jgi:hypothetical protein